MKILLLGENGYLGSYLRTKLNVDVLESRKLYNNGVRYDYIINCIAKPIIEYCELHKKESDYANRDIILDIKKLYPEAKLIHFSTYYIYDYKGLCNEDSPVTYKYNYTRQKLESELLIDNGITFRLGKLFGHPDIDKQNKLTEHIIKNDELFLDEVYFNPTSLNQVVNAIWTELMTKELNGIYNLSNAGVTTSYDYGLFINEILGTNKKINKIECAYRSFEHYGNFLMVCRKIEKYTHLFDWEDELIKYLKNLKYVTKY